MTRMGVVLQLYSEMVERRPFSRFSKDPKEILANCNWIKRAEEWGNVHVDAWGHFIGLYQ